MNLKSEKKFIVRSLFVCVLILFILNFNSVISAVSVVWSVIFPLVLGFIIAYILNILMNFIDTKLLKRFQGKIMIRFKKPLSLLLSFAFVASILYVVINLVFPQVISTLTALTDTLPEYYEQIKAWILDQQQHWPAIADWLNESDINSESIMQSIMEFGSNTLNQLLNSSIGIVMAITAGIFNIIIALIFAVYLLMNKEKLLFQLSNFQKAFMKKEHVNTINEISGVANESFSSFIVGQCTEAVILGVLCIVGMWIFRFPYATSVGVFVGMTSLIPIFGAYLGGAVGVLLILSVDPFQALLFIVFLIVLQQLEGDLIYPKVVGDSIGLPGIWVFAAVMIGGGLYGVVGMLLGVPVTATIYKLLQKHTRIRLKTQVPMAKIIE